MRRTIGRQAVFFASIVVVCVLLVPATPAELRWVVWSTAGLGAFWAVLFGLGDLLRPLDQAKAKGSVPTESPFVPPPRPGR